MTEVDLWTFSDTVTYNKVVDTTKQEIIDTQYKFNTVHDIRENERVNDLPYIFAISKFHENPIKFR